MSRLSITELVAKLKPFECKNVLQGQNDKGALFRALQGRGVDRQVDFMANLLRRVSN